MEDPAVNPGTDSRVVLPDPTKWRTLLDEFENVLNINIFIVDPDGKVVIPANSMHHRQGGGDVFGFSLLKKTFSLYFNDRGEVLSEAEERFLERFERDGQYSQIVDPFDLRLFAAPVIDSGEKVLFYLIVGPLCLGKMWPDEKYRALAESLGLGIEDILRSIRSVPEMSKAVLTAVLDLLVEVARDVYELNSEKERFAKLQTQSQSVRPEILSAAQDLLTDIQHDELLIATLDSAIKMAGAEGGSIMILDEIKNDFVVKVSRGLGQKMIEAQTRIKIGDGIAGIAAKEKIPFVTSGTQGDPRIQHFLKRPDIAQSFVFPIVYKDKVLGVLNLSVKDIEKTIIVDEVRKDILKFSPLIAAALKSL